MSILAGLAQGFAQAKERSKDRALIEEFKKSQKKLIDAQVDSVVAKNQAMERLKQATAGDPGINPTSPQAAYAEKPVPATPPKGLIDILLDPQHAGDVIQAGVPVGAVAALQQNQNNMSIMDRMLGGLQGGGGGGMLPGSVQMGMNGPQFSMEPARLSKEIPSEDGLSIIQLDQQGNVIGRRPAAPGERSQSPGEKTTETGTANLKLKVKGGLATVDELERVYSEIITANSFTERAAAMKIYSDMVEGTVAPIVKSAGESGNLATEDIERAIKLIPGAMSSMTGYTREIAQKKFENLRSWLRSIPGDQGEQSALPEGIPDGSKQIGTSNGKPVYQAPNGKQYILDY